MLTFSSPSQRRLPPCWLPARKASVSIAMLNSTVPPLLLLGQLDFCWGDSTLFQKATGLYTRATQSTGGNSRNRLDARGGNSRSGKWAHGGGDSLAPLGPSPLARRPRRARLAPATCARRGRLALAPLPRAPPAPLPPRSLPTNYEELRRVLV